MHPALERFLARYPDDPRSATRFYEIPPYPSPNPGVYGASYQSHSDLRGAFAFAIDPRGMAGEVAYDIAVIALKAARHVPSLLGVTRLARSVGIDSARARVWLLVADAARV